MNHLKLILAAAGLFAVTAASAQQLTPEQKAKLAQFEAMERSFHPATGDVSIPQANAVLHLGKDYYYLPPAEAKQVIVDAWANPPTVADGNLGLVFEAGKHFYGDAWGAVLTYEPMGYVTDDDAKTADYAELLSTMQSGEDDLNARRREGGYPAQHLIGWAQQPAYDAPSHSVVWAQNIAFEGQPDNSLNYDVRLLGRHGVLSLNMITEMSKLDETRPAAMKLARSTAFIPGARYADYQEGVDAKSGLGIAGLVAAGVGVVAAKKIGLIALILVFAKKFLVLILAGGAAIAAYVRRLFGRDKAEENHFEPTQGETFEPTRAETEEPAAPVPTAADTPQAP
jgi:uncharacterized membrane-anchored protein